MPDTDTPRKVAVTGSFVRWRTSVPLAPNDQGQFAARLLLEPGVHTYKFIVDGVWRAHPDQPTCRDAIGQLNNFIDVRPLELRSFFRSGRKSPPGEYGTQMPEVPPARSGSSLASSPGGTRRAAAAEQKPPSMPPHLLRALLNTRANPEDPSLLPLPHHVMVHHLYVLPRDEARPVRVFGSTSMFKGKYVTTVYYKPPLSTMQTVTASGVHGGTGPANSASLSSSQSRGDDMSLSASLMFNERE